MRRMTSVHTSRIRSADALLRSACSRPHSGRPGYSPCQLRRHDHPRAGSSGRYCRRRRRIRLWQKISPMTLPLSGQIITRPVWPEPTAHALTVRALHNGTDIAFLLEWQDNTKNDRLTPGTFRDGVALGLAARRCAGIFLHGPAGSLHQYLALESRLAERHRPTSAARTDEKDKSAAVSRDASRSFRGELIGGRLDRRRIQYSDHQGKAGAGSG